MVVSFFCLFGWGFLLGFCFGVFFVSPYTAWTAAASALRAGCAPAPAAPSLCWAGGGSWFAWRRRVVPAVPPAAIPPGRPAGSGRLLASSRSPDAPGARERLEGEVGGSAALVPQRVRRAWWLCGTENFASELGLAEIKEQRAASPPPQNSTQTPRRCCRLPSANSNEEQNTSGFKVFEVQNCLEYKGFWL